jgi:hypothetical protein
VRKPWTYDQSTGDLLDPDGRFVGTGYSGAGRKLADGRNNGKLEAEVGKGPIPRGLWRIGPSRTHPQLGPIAMPLTPVEHDAHGRSGFYIHGDNTAGDASHGCVILGRAFRQIINSSPECERYLNVVA